MTRVATGSCVECSHPYAVTLATGYGAASHNEMILADLVCSSCGERPVLRCGLCANLAVDEHEECVESERERERRDRAQADYEDACDRRGDELRR